MEAYNTEVCYGGVVRWSVIEAYDVCALWRSITKVCYGSVLRKCVMKVYYGGVQHE